MFNRLEYSWVGDNVGNDVENFFAGSLLPPARSVCDKKIFVDYYSSLSRNPGALLDSDGVLQTDLKDCNHRCWAFGRSCD
jgi:hypothetical protein